MVESAWLMEPPRPLNETGAPTMGAPLASVNRNEMIPSAIP